MLTFMLPIVLAAQPSAGEPVHRYWPQYAPRRNVVVVPFIGDHELGITYETAAGLAAGAVLRGEYDTLLHEDVSGNSSYAKWTEMML
ncbi:MAG TPA: hypothetical protein QGH10_12225, partial [Armatimonadota bacterium]|nr:hypothetical protein [Armatimonadota bacterium]